VPSSRSTITGRYAPGAESTRLVIDDLVCLRDPGHREPVLSGLRLAEGHAAELLATALTQRRTSPQCASAQVWPAPGSTTSGPESVAALSIARRASAVSDGTSASGASNSSSS